uniref:Uncharacterized protein n=1 Tax=Rhizophora mucronata TaxID=61149 RepID=A0A2P2QHV1_RHIMU
MIYPFFSQFLLQFKCEVFETFH